MRRPVVGVTGYNIDAIKARQLGFGPRPLHVHPDTYLRWLRDAGMLPVPVPMHPDSLHGDYLDLFDGLLLTGGADIDPERYGAERHPLSRVEPERDEFEFGLVEAALARDLPMLGICRGMQLLNVALGGTLHQHLPERSSELVHSSEYRDGMQHPGEMWLPSFHDVTVTDPALAALTGAVVRTNTYHHQGVAALGDGLRVASRASDGLVEAVIGVDHPVLGVQWHPEMHEVGEPAGDGPFAWLHGKLAAVTADESLALT